MMPFNPRASEGLENAQMPDIRQTKPMTVLLRNCGVKYGWVYFLTYDTPGGKWRRRNRIEVADIAPVDAEAKIYAAKIQVDPRYDATFAAHTAIKTWGWEHNTAVARRFPIWRAA